MPKPIEVVAALIVEEGRVLVARRTAGQSYAGLWEFPGGKLETGESPEEGLARELREELGIGTVVGERVDAIVNRGREGKPIRITFYRVQRRDGQTPRPLEVDEVRWVDGNTLPTLEFIPANQPVVERLARELGADGP